MAINIAAMKWWGLALMWWGLPSAIASALREALGISGGRLR